MAKNKNRLSRNAHLCVSEHAHIADGAADERQHMFYHSPQKYETLEHVVKLTKQNILNDSIFFGRTKHDIFQCVPLYIVRVLLRVLFGLLLICCHHICLCPYAGRHTSNHFHFFYLSRTTQSTSFCWCIVFPKKAKPFNYHIAFSSLHMRSHKLNHEKKNGQEKKGIICHRLFVSNGSCQLVTGERLTFRVICTLTHSVHN